MTRFSEEFYAHIDDSVRGLGVVSSQLATEEVLPAVLQDWFTILWHAIRATTPLFNHAVALLSSRGDDAFHRTLGEFYRHKIDEETGHDEMLVADLGRLGVSADRLQRSLAPAPIAAMVGSQFYLIEFAHPCAFLGYLALFEGNPLPIPALERAIKISQAPAEAWSTYRMHAEVDTWHRQEIEGMLDLIPQDEFLRRAIMSNALRSAEYYCQSLEDLLESAASNRVAS